MRLSHIQRMRFRKSLAPLAITIGVIGAVVLLQYLTGAWPFNKRAESKSTEIAVDTSSFEFMLQQGSIKQLKDLLEENIYRKSDDLTVRLDRMQNRIAILDRISELDEEQDSRELAISDKLTVLVEREILTMLEGIGTSQQTKELRELADALSSSTKTSVSSLAHSALAVASMSRHLQEVSPDRRDALLPTAAASFRRLLGSPAIGKDNDHRMEKCLKAFRDGCSPQTFTKFAEAVGSDLPDSPLLTTFNQMAADYGLGLVDILDATQPERNAAADKLLHQIESKLQENELSDYEVSSILNRVDDLLRLGMSEQATRALKTLEAVQPSNSRDDLANSSGDRLEIINKNLELFENPFKIDGLIDMSNNQPASFKNDQSVYKILFLMPAGDRDSMLKFKSFQRVVESRVRNGKIEVAMIFVDENKTKLTEDDIQEISRQSDQWRFWLLNPDADGASLILDQLTIEKFPYMVVLDKDQKVALLDPPLDIIAGLKQLYSVAFED